MSSETGLAPRNTFTQNRKRKAPHGYHNKNVIFTKEMENAHKPFQDIPKLEVNDEKKRAMEDDVADATETLYVGSLYNYQEIIGKSKWLSPLSQRIFQVTLNEKIDEMPNFEQAFMLCIMDLAAKYNHQIGKNFNFLGFEISHNELRDTICLPYRHVSALEADELAEWIDILNNRFPRLEKISNYEFMIKMCFVKQVGGTGTNERRKTKSKYHNRKGIEQKYNVTINNVSQLCLATAIKQGMSYVAVQEEPENPENLQIYNRWLGVNDSSTELLKEAKDMLVAAKIEKTANFTLEDVRELQKLYQGQYKIVVFLEGSSAKPIFRAESELGDTKVIGLQCSSPYENGHWQFIPSLAKYLDTNFYCVKCNVKSKEPANHYNCPDLCKNCKMKNCPENSKNEPITCQDCNQEFKNDICFENHKKPGLIGKTSMCERPFKCYYCGNNYPMGQMDTHPCRKKECGHCLSTEGISHHCTLSSQIFKRRHFSEKMSFFLVEALDKSFSCDVCSPQGRVKIFESVQEHSRDKDVVADLMHYLTHVDNHKRKSVTFKMSKTFNQCLLEYAVRDDVVPFTKVYVHQGNVRAMFQRNSSTHIIDLFNMLPAEGLRELTTAFGVEKLVNSNFPSSLLKTENFGMLCGWQAVAEKIDWSCEKEPTHVATWVRARSKLNRKFFFPDEIFSALYSKLAEFSYACTKMTDLFRETADIHLFSEAHDIRTAAHKLYSRNFVLENTLPLDYMLTTSKRSFSNVAITYLAWRAHSEGVPVDTVANVGEYKIPYTTYSIDGFIQPCEKYPNGLGIDVKGCYWHAHGCPHVPTMIARRNLSVPIIREHDRQREEAVREKIPFEGFFECEIADLRKTDPEMDQYMATIKAEYKGVDLKLGKYPLRADVFRLKEETNNEQSIKKINLKNIIPYVLKYKEFPVGPYKKLHGNTVQVPIAKPEELKDRGVYRCKVLAPRDLQIPVLPVRVNGNHMFSLCTECSFLLNHPPSCPHTDDERLLIGTWTTFELTLALQQGYVIKEVIGAITWPKWMKLKVNAETGEAEEEGFFSGFVDMIREIYGSSCKDQMDESKTGEVPPRERSLIDELVYQKEQDAGKPELFVNAGHGMFDVCEQWARRSDYEKTEQAKDHGELSAIIEDHTNEVQEITNFGGSRSLVTYKKTKSEEGNTKKTVLLPLILMTSHARIEQYRLMQEIGIDRMIYIDPEIIIYKDSADSPLANLEQASMPLRGFITSRIQKYVTEEEHNLPGGPTELKQTVRVPVFQRGDCSAFLSRIARNIELEADSLLAQQPRLVDISYTAIMKDTNDIVKNTEKKKRITARLWGRIPTDTGYCRSIGA